MSRDLHKRRKVTDIAAVRTPLPEPAAPPLHLAAPANAPLTAAPTAPVQETVAPPEAAPLAYDFGSMRVFPDQHASAPTPPAAPPTAPPTPPSGSNQGTGTATPAQHSFPVQASLRINPPDDAYEQEAEQVASAVTHDADGPADLQGPPDIASLYVQRSNSAPGLPVSPSVESSISRMQNGGGQPLPAADQSFFEQRFGHDFSQIRIHNDTDAAETSRSINARAFTVGNHIAFDAGEYQPGTASGRHLLAHELTHTIQQTGGVAAKRADKPRAGHHFGAIQLYPSTLAVQRAPAADEGVCPVCGKVGTGTCPDCGQPFLPVQRSLRPGADPLAIQRKAGPDLDLEDELRRALEQRGGNPQQGAGAAQGDLSAQNSAGGADSAVAAQSAPEAMQALREGKLPGVGSPAGTGAGAPAGAADAAVGLPDGAASGGAPTAASQGAQAADPTALSQPAAQPPEAALVAQSITEAAAQPAEAPAQPAAEAPAAPAAGGAQALPETQPAQADGGAATAAAQNAAALLESAAADTPLPDAQPEVTPPQATEPVDAAGMPLPGDPETEAQIADLAGQVQQLREQGEGLRAQAAEQRDNAGILRGNAQLIQSNIAASESGTKTAEGHLTARRDALTQARQALTASEKKAETVATKGQDGVTRSGDERKRSEPMATKSRDLVSENRANTPDDPEAAQNAREQGNKLNQVGSDSEQIDDALVQAQDASTQLVQDAAQATQVNSQTSGKIDTVESTLEQTDKRIGEMQQQSTDARGQIEALSDGPETVQSSADALDEQGQALIQQSVALEARLHEAQASYLDGMRQVPAPEPPTPENTPPEQLAALASEAGEDPALYGLGVDETGLEDAGFGAEAQDFAIEADAEAANLSIEDFTSGDQDETLNTDVIASFIESISVGFEPEEVTQIDSEQTLISRKAAEPDADNQLIAHTSVSDDLPVEITKTISDKTDKPIDLSENIPGWLIDAPPVNDQDRLDAQQQEEQRRKDALKFIQGESDQGFENLSASEKRIIALKLTSNNLFGGIDKISWPSMGDVGKGVAEAAIGTIDPRSSLKGVIDGISMIVNGVVDFVKEPSWGGALKMAAEIASGLTIILASITALAGVIIALMGILTIATLGAATPITAPIIAFCTTVMTTVGGWTLWAGLIAAGLQSLVFIKDIYMAGAAKTADELFNHSEEMTNDAKKAGDALAQSGVDRLLKVGGKPLKGKNNFTGGYKKNFSQSNGSKSNIKPAKSGKSKDFIESKDDINKNSGVLSKKSLGKLYGGNDLRKQDGNIGVNKSKYKKIVDYGRTDVMEYGKMSGTLAKGRQAHHLNQDAAYKSYIPKNKGAAISLEGNAFKDYGKAHHTIHKHMEEFWEPYRMGGAKVGQTPTNGEYSQALRKSLRAAGFSEKEAKILEVEARKNREKYGLKDDDPVPHIPRRIYQKKQPKEGDVEGFSKKN